MDRIQKVNIATRLLPYSPRQHTSVGCHSTYMMCVVQVCLKLLGGPKPGVTPPWLQTCWLVSTFFAYMYCHLVVIRVGYRRNASFPPGDDDLLRLHISRNEVY